MPAAPKCLVHALSNFSRLTHLPRNETRHRCARRRWRSVVGISTFFPSKEFIFSQVLVVERQAARFYKFASKALWSRRHLTSWKRLPLGSQIPRSLVSAASDKQRERACGEFIKILQPSVCLLIPNLNMNFPKLLLCYLIWCSAH